MDKLEINKSVIIDFLKKNNLTQSDASVMLGKQSNYISRILDPNRVYFTDKTIDTLCELGIDRDVLLNTAPHVETRTGKVMERDASVNDLHDILNKKFEQSPEVAAAARATDENGERLSFDERMKLLRTPQTINQKEFEEERRKHERDLEIRKAYIRAYSELVEEIMTRFQLDPSCISFGLMTDIMAMHRDFKAQIDKIVDEFSA